MASDSVTAFFTSRRWRGRPYLISPFADALCAGGLALVVFVALFVVFPLQDGLHYEQRIAMIALSGWIAYLINDPHFMASYQLLYRDFPRKLERFRTHRELYVRYLMAGIIAPALMLTYFLAAFSTQDESMFAWSVMAMKVLVAWHYTKQSFGVFMMLSALKSVRYSAWQRRFLLINAYAAWGVYNLIILAYTTAQDPFLPHPGGPFISLPKAVEPLMALVLMGGALASILVMVWEKKNASKTAMLGYLSMYYFLFAASLHPFWILLYPLFHSLQYMLFVFALKRGEAEATAKRPAPHVARFMATAFVLGIVFFWALPQALETGLQLHAGIALPVMAAFIVFINIHHYFIDNVVWRKEHAEISNYLFYPPR